MTALKYIQYLQRKLSMHGITYRKCMRFDTDAVLIEQLELEKAELEVRCNGILKDYYAERQTCDEQKTEIERLTEELKNLDWYKMWHNRHQTEINDLTLELETYRPTKLSGHGQCKCANCGSVSWTDWFSRYKGKTLCNECLKEIMTTEEKQVVKDTAKEILQGFDKWLNQAISDSYNKSVCGSMHHGGRNAAFHEVKELVKKVSESKGVEVE